MRARIRPHTKSTTQSGHSFAGEWILSFQPRTPELNEPLMGWWGSGDMQSQINLRFSSREDAIAYAEREGIAYDLELPPARRRRAKAYADNFRFGRTENWTH